MRIYVASSWRNDRQPEVIHALRSAGHEVYNFRHPDSGGPQGKPGSTRGSGFAWSSIDPDWETWSSPQFRDLLFTHPAATEGFESAAAALAWCELCVLVLPCGRSAHLEAGWAVGAGKRLLILLSGQDEPELMYRYAHGICTSINELVGCCFRHGVPRSETVVESMPHSEESERAVLAAILLDPRILPTVTGRLRAEDFYFEKHQTLYEGMIALAGDQVEVDLRTLQAKLEQRGALERVGGVAYLASLDLDLPDLGRVEAYVEIVKERSVRRRLIEVSGTIIRDCSAP